MRSRSVFVQDADEQNNDFSSEIFNKNITKKCTAALNNITWLENRCFEDKCCNQNERHLFQ